MVDSYTYLRTRVFHVVHETKMLGKISPGVKIIANDDAFVYPAWEISGSSLQEMQEAV